MTKGVTQKKVRVSRLDHASATGLAQYTAYRRAVCVAALSIKDLNKTTPTHAGHVRKHRLLIGQFQLASR